MNMNFTKFPASVLGEKIREHYSKLYREASYIFIDILHSSTEEIAVISSLSANLSDLMMKKKEEK